MDKNKHKNVVDVIENNIFYLLTKITNIVILCPLLVGNVKKGRGE
jgi:hypothetical protein